MFSAFSTAQTIVASGTIASAATIVAQSAINDGLDPTTGWAMGVVVAGTGVFLFMDRRAQRKETNAAAERRKADDENKEKLRLTEAKLEQERQAHIATIEALHDRHMQTIENMNQRIIDILTSKGFPSA